MKKHLRKQIVKKLKKYGIKDDDISTIKKDPDCYNMFVWMGDTDGVVFINWTYPWYHWLTNTCKINMMYYQCKDGKEPLIYNKKLGKLISVNHIGDMIGDFIEKTSVIKNR